MRLTGCFLLLCGWLIVVAALLLLSQPGERLGFLTAGLAIEGVGWVLLAQGYATLQRESPMQEDQA